MLILMSDWQILRGIPQMILGGILISLIFSLFIELLLTSEKRKWIRILPPIYCFVAYKILECGFSVIYQNQLTSLQTGFFSPYCKIYVFLLGIEIILYDYYLYLKEKTPKKGISDNLKLAWTRIYYSLSVFCLLSSAFLILTFAMSIVKIEPISQIYLVWVGFFLATIFISSFIDFYSVNLEEVENYFLYSTFKYELNPFSNFYTTTLMTERNRYSGKHKLLLSFHLNYEDYNSAILVNEFYNRKSIIEKKQNKYHILYLKSKELNKYTQKEKEAIYKILEEDEKVGIQPIIYDNYSKEKTLNELGKELSLKYPYYRKYILFDSMNEIIKDVLKNKDNNYLSAIRKQAKKIIEMIFSYQKKDTLNNLKEELYDTKNDLKLFYTAIKICEFTFFIRCLRENKEKILDFEKPSIGQYVQHIEDDTIYQKDEYKDLIQSAIYLDKSAVRNNKSELKQNQLSYKKLCEVICKVRNRYIGHGSMIYSVSAEFVYHVLIVTEQIVKRYYETYKELENIKVPLKEYKPPLYIEYNAARYYYSSQLEKDYFRYLEYESGKIITYKLSENKIITSITLASEFYLDKAEGDE